MLSNTAKPVQAILADDTTKSSSSAQVHAVDDVEEVHNATPRDSSDHASPHLHLDLDLNATHLISSPYNDFANQLRLEPLDTQSRLFAFALTYFNRIQDDYATAPYMTAFNWPFVFEVLRALCSQTGIQWKRQEFYVVIFRSKLLADADRVRLGMLDQKSHEEACASGGLLHYWFGSTNTERRNLATCESITLHDRQIPTDLCTGMWVAREDAAAGGRGPWHKQARGAAREMYETISFHTHTLVVEDGASSWRLEDFVG